MLNAFWWSNGYSNECGVHWKCWELLCISKRDGGLGLKNIHNFNLALLTKQGWRLLSNQTSLVSHIFKARYYSSSNFLNAKIESNPTYAWRSIWATQDLLNSGGRYRVGSSSSINVWEDPWLDDDGSPLIETPVRSGMENLKVSDLIDFISREWDISLINSLFSFKDCEEIIAILVSRFTHKDKWRWKPGDKGAYSVKNGYQQLAATSLPVLGPAVIPWCSIWNLNIPGKVQNFLWRVFSLSLPTKVALQARHVDIQTICALCNSETEIDLHVLVACPKAKAVWVRSPFGDQFAGHGSCSVWWNAARNKFSKSELEGMACMLWSIWFHRNKAIWKGKLFSPTAAYFMAKNMIDQWGNSKESSSNNSSRSTAAAPKWENPPFGRVKCNVDASVDTTNNRMGYGFIIRDHTGNFLAGGAGRRENAQPKVAGAIGIREVLSWLKRHDITNATVETDSLLFVNAFNKKEPDLSVFGLVLDDCGTIVETLESCNVEFVGSSANEVAHSIARVALSKPGFEDWENVPPQFISDVIYSS